MIRPLQFLLLFFLLPFITFSQTSHAGPIGKEQPGQLFPGSFATVEWQGLHSTHGNLFNGFSLLYSRPVTPLLVLGVGVEYSFAPYHEDNGWKLYHLKFIPFFGDAKIFLLNKNKITSYLQVETGPCFVTYKKEDQNTIGEPYYVSEWGLYVYSGAGMVVPVGKNTTAVLGMGFKGFHLSFNALEVNPHGVVVRAGLKYRLPVK